MTCLFVVALLFLATFASAADEKRHGVNFLSGQWSPSTFNSSVSFDSLSAAQTGAGVNWIALTYCHFQWTVDSTGPIYARASTPSAEELGAIVKRAHAMGIKVMFRPCIDPDWSNPETQGTWRGMIGRNFTASQWTTWFSNYVPFIVEQAKLAQALKANVFSIGMEYIDPSHQTAHWVVVADTVRSYFSGPITYCANHGNEDSVGFWSSVDEISVDAYYTLDASSTDPTLPQIKEAWAPIVESLGNLSKANGGKPVNFAEIGYCSVTGTNSYPSPCNDVSKLNLELQARLYTAFYEAVYPQPWFQGVFWWAWTTDTLPSGPQDAGFSPRGKPAEQVMQKFART